MKKLQLTIFLLIIMSSNAIADSIFSCTAITGEKINLYKKKDKLYLTIGDKIVESQDSYQNIVSGISNLMSVNNDYLEFRANKYYISIGNENTQEEANGHNEKEIVRISTLLPDRSGEKSTKGYECTSQYQNNIPDLSLE